MVRLYAGDDVASVNLNKDNPTDVSIYNKHFGSLSDSQIKEQYNYDRRPSINQVAMTPKEYQQETNRINHPVSSEIAGTAVGVGIATAVGIAVFMLTRSKSK